MEVKVIIFIITFIIVIVMVTQHIPIMTKSHHGGEMSVMMKVGMRQCQKPTIPVHHDEFDFRVHVYQVTYVTSGSYEFSN